MNVSFGKNVITSRQEDRPKRTPGSPYRGTRNDTEFSCHPMMPMPTFAAEKKCT
ncbi:MAG: hypothetical protein Q4D19_05785 [Lautropia sp.]|nr:hypothetical protein [Lautropia sp.]